MPKVKTHSGSAKRFKKTSNGKIKRAKAYRRHHAWAKNTKQKRGLRKGVFFGGSELSRISILLPY